MGSGAGRNVNKTSTLQSPSGPTIPRRQANDWGAGVETVTAGTPIGGLCS